MGFSLCNGTELKSTASRTRVNSVFHDKIGTQSTRVSRIIASFVKISLNFAESVREWISRGLNSVELILLIRQIRFSRQIVDRTISIIHKQIIS